MFTLILVLFFSFTSYAETGISYTPRADLSMGGTHFDMTFDDLANPARVYPTWVGVSLNDKPVIMDDQGNENVRIDCGSLSCTFFIPGAITSVTYDFYFYVAAPTPFSFDATGTVTESIPKWWRSTQIATYDYNIFTGYTDISFRFTNVPASLTSVMAGAFTDPNQTGILSGGAGTACTLETGGTYLCTFVGLPPLCSEVNGGGCDGDNNYYFGINFAAMTTIQAHAVFVEMSQYEEGQYIGNFNYDQGAYLQQRLNLNVFEFENPTACSLRDEPYYCWEVGYYQQWVLRYLTDFNNLMRSTGQFTVNRQGEDAVVSAAVPKLPVGSRGYGVILAYYPNGNPLSVTEITMDCTVSSCTPVTIAGINPDLYQFELRIYNKHPQITYEDYNTGEPVVFGEELLKTIKYGSVFNRQIFYNRSTSTVFGNGSGNPVDAIDNSKIGVLPGENTNTSSYTNYNKGLNGIVIDLRGDVGNVLASDFKFETWNGMDSDGFLESSAIATITKIPLGGSLGETRIKIEFADNAIRNTWLKITVVANARTGLFKEDVFYFGNAVGDMLVGNIGSPVTVRVNATDTSTIRQKQSLSENSAPISNVYDVNKDGRVNAIDTSIVRQNQSNGGVISYFTAPFVIF